MTQHTMVTLYESNAGDLFIAADDGALAYDVTAGEDAGFEADAVALLNGDTDDWTVDYYPLADITASVGEMKGRAPNQAIATVALYDDNVGRVEIVRHAGTMIVAGHNGRRYIGGLENEA